MANPLREALATKYSGSSPGVTESPGGSSNSLRESLTKKYGPKAELNPVTIAGSGRNVYNSGPSVTPADNRTNREKYTTKYAEPVANSRVGKERATVAEAIKKKNIEENGSIASPEYFATSVDVRSPSGKFLKTFEAEGPGEAKRLATEYAIENDGYIQVTPPGGVFGKVYTRVKEAFQGALDNYQEKAGGFLTDLGGQMPNPDGGPNRVDDPNAGPLRRTTSGIELGVAGVEVLLSPLSAAFMGAEELPIAGKPVQGINYIFGKLGEGGGWAADKAVDALPVTDATKDEIRPAAEELTSLLAQLAGGKATVVGYKKSAALREKIKVSMTKDIIETNQLPRNVYISPEAVRSIFIDSSKLTEAEASMIKDLGLDGKGYRQAIKDGISIEIPAERIITIVDKPWFAQVKSIFNIEPTSERVVNTQGKTVQRTPQKEVLRLDEGKSPNSTPVPIQPAKNAPEALITESITPSLLERVNSLTPAESVAFGQKIVGGINETLGLKIDPAKANLPEGDLIKVTDSPSLNGIPAEYKNGKVEIYMPDVMKNLKKLSEGATILAHEGVDSTVYKKLEGESMEELSVRYVRDIVMHEVSHARTMSFEDQTKMQNLQSKINEAKLAQNNSAMIDARKNLQTFMASLENKANTYMKENKTALEKELFGGAKRKSQTSLQRKINKKVSNSDSGKSLKRSEKQVLKNKLKVEARGSRFGKKAGTKEERSRSKKEAENKKDILEESNKRSTELKTLKQRIVDRDRSNKKVDEQRSMRQTAVEKINDKKSTLAERKKAAIDYAKILPFRERGKFLKAINNLSSNKEFLDVLDRISKASRASERRAMISEIKDLLNGVKVKTRSGFKVGKMNIDQQRFIDLYNNESKKFEQLAKQRRDAGDKDISAYELAQTEIANLIAEERASNPYGEIPGEILKKTEILGMVGLKDQTLSELSQTLSRIESVIEKGKTLRELDRFNLETKRQRNRDKGLEILTGGKKLPSESEGIRREKSLGVIKGVVEKIMSGEVYLIEGWAEVGDALSKFEKGGEVYGSHISKMMREVKNARSDEYRGTKKMIQKVDAAIKDIYGLKNDKEAQQLFIEMSVLESVGKIPLEDGTIKNFKLTRAEAVKYKMLFEDPRLEKDFDKAGWTPEIKEKITSILTKEDIAMGKWYIDVFYRDYYDRLNAVYVKDAGVDMTFSEFHSPLPRNIEDIIPTSVLLARESAAYATARTGSLKERVDNNLEIKATNVFQESFGHILHSEHYIAWQERLNDLRSFYGNKEVRQAIREFHGKYYLDFIDEALNDFARGGVAKEKVVKWVDTWRTNTTKAILGANWKVAIKQPIGVANFLMELDTVPFVKGVADFWTDPINNVKFLSENSALFKERYDRGGWERDIKAAQERGYDKALASRVNKLNFDEALFIMLRAGDASSVMQGMWASYKDGLKKGMTEKKAIEYAEDIVERTQETSGLDTLSPVQRGGSWAKLFTMFQGQPVKYLRVMVNSARNLKYGRGSKSRNIKNFVVAWMVAPLLYNLFANHSFLVDDKYKKSNKEVLLRSIFGPITYIPLMGQMGQSLLDRAFGDRFNFGGSATFSSVTDLEKAIDQLRIGDIVDAITYIVDAAGKLAGVPTGIITRPIRNAGKEDSSSSSETVSF